MVMQYYTAPVEDTGANQSTALDHQMGFDQSLGVQQEAAYMDEVDEGVFHYD